MDKVLKVVEGFSLGRDPLELSRDLGFVNQRDLGDYMGECGYFWDGERGNYFRMEDGEEFLSRYGFRDSSAISNPNTSILAKELSKIDVDDYYSMPLFLKQDVYRALIVFVRENNLDYNRVVEDALRLYFKS